MKNSFLCALTTMALLAATSPAHAATSTAARRQFLVNLGFDDVPAQIRAKLVRREFQTELNRRQMENNVTAYEVLNAARELAVRLLGEVAPGPLDPQSPEARALALFTAKMLALNPLSPPTDYPADILGMKEDDARETALITWMHGERVQQMNQHKLRLLSDLASLAPNADPRELKKMDQDLTVIVERMYLDDTIGSGKYFGRALAALLAREDQRAQTNALTTAIANELRGRYGLHLENFIGDTLVIPTDAGEKRYRVENGTMMLTRNISPGSLEISVAAIPERIVDRWRARAKGLIGTPVALPFMVDPEDEADGITLTMRLRDRIAQAGLLRTGFSHITFFEIKEDPATGIKMPRVIDNYPNRVFDVTAKYLRTGGTRFTYPEQVIDLSHNAAVYFASPIPEKIVEWSHRNQKETGYQAEFFPSLEVEMPDGITPVKNDHVVNWQTQITRAEYDRLNAETDPRQLSREVYGRFTRGLEQTVLEGWIFHWPDPYDFYLVGGTYCSQLGDMVMRRTVGMPLEENKSVWHWGVRLLAHIGQLGAEMKGVPGLRKVGEKILAFPGVEKSMKVTGIKIIAPSSLALQPFMAGQFFRFGVRTPEQRARASYLAGDYREADPRRTAELARILTPEDFSRRETNVVLDYGTAMKDLEYGMVMRAARGLTTHGFSPDDFARLAVEKEAPKFAPVPPAPATAPLR